MKKSPAARKDEHDDEDFLPRWDLTKLYPGIDAPALQADMKKATRLADEFRRTYEKGVSRLSGPELGKAIGEYEKIESLNHKIYRYGQLLEEEDSDNFARTTGLKKW